MSKLVFHNIIQNTEDWLSLRAGHVGGSSISCIMAYYGDVYKKGPKAGELKPMGDPAQSLAVKIAIEQITGQPIESTYKNSDMDRGHEQEPIARAMYEEQHFTDVNNGGFFESGIRGASPDGCIDGCGLEAEGLGEIKSRIFSIQYDTVVKNAYPTGDKWQLLFNMQTAQKRWIDYISYCATFPDDKQLFVQRLLAKDYVKEFAMMDKRMAEFEELVAVKKKVVEAI